MRRGEKGTPSRTLSQGSGVRASPPSRLLVHTPSWSQPHTCRPPGTSSSTPPPLPAREAAQGGPRTMPPPLPAGEVTQEGPRVTPPPLPGETGGPGRCMSHEHSTLTRSRTCTRAAWLGRASEKAGTLKESVVHETQDRRTDRSLTNTERCPEARRPHAASALWGSGPGVGPQRNGQWGSWGEVLLALPGPQHIGTRTPRGGREREGRPGKRRVRDGPARLETPLRVDTHLHPRQSWESRAG